MRIERVMELTAELILGALVVGLLLAAAVKNRNGPADPTGRSPVELFVRPERMSITESYQAWVAAAREWSR